MAATSFWRQLPLRGCWLPIGRHTFLSEAELSVCVCQAQCSVHVLGMRAIRIRAAHLVSLHAAMRNEISEKGASMRFTSRASMACHTHLGTDVQPKACEKYCQNNNLPIQHWLQFLEKQASICYKTQMLKLTPHAHIRILPVDD